MDLQVGLPDSMNVWNIQELQITITIILHELISFPLDLVPQRCIIPPCIVYMAIYFGFLVKFFL